MRGLLVEHPTPSALRQAGRARIARTLKVRSPRLAAEVVEDVLAALDAQTVVVPRQQVGVEGGPQADS